MHRAKLLDLEAHFNLHDLPSDQILITSSIFGRYNRQLAYNLAERENPNRSKCRMSYG